MPQCQFTKIACLCYFNYNEAFLGGWREHIQSQIQIYYFNILVVEEGSLLNTIPQSYLKKESEVSEEKESVWSVLSACELIHRDLFFLIVWSSESTCFMASWIETPPPNVQSTHLKRFLFSSVTFYNTAKRYRGKKKWYSPNSWWKKLLLNQFNVFVVPGGTSESDLWKPGVCTAWPPRGGVHRAVVRFL